MGKKDFKISTNYSSQDFLDKNKEFLNHLSFIYETSDKNKIVDSIDKNVYGAVDVVLHYNSNVKKINPILEVKKNQLQFYAIDPLDEDYNI